MEELIIEIKYFLKNKTILLKILLWGNLYRICFFTYIHWLVIPLYWRRIRKFQNFLFGHVSFKFYFICIINIPSTYSFAVNELFEKIIFFFCFIFFLFLIEKFSMCILDINELSANHLSLAFLRYNIFIIFNLNSI